MISSSPAETRESNNAPVAGESWRRPSLTPLTLFLVLLTAYVLIQIKLVLVLTLLALLFATIIERPVEELQKRGLHRGVGILMVYVAIIGTLVLAGFLVAPAMADEAQSFRDEAPAEIQDLRSEWRQSDNGLLNGAGQEFLGRAIAIIQDPPAPEGDTAVTVATGIGGGIVGFFGVLAIAFYYLMEKPLLRRLVLMEVRPEARPRVTRIWDAIEDKVGRWLRGQLTLCLIIGTLATVGYGTMGVKFWPVLGLWAGLTEIIPIVGPWLGGIPAVVIALTDSWQQALMVTGFILLLQALENMVLVPRVMRGAVGLTPLTVFVAILAGTEFMGPAGAVLAIPVAAIIQVFLTDYLDARRGSYRLPASAMPGWRWMRGPLGLSTAAGDSMEEREVLAAPEAPPPPADRPTTSAGAAKPRQSARTGERGGPPGWTTDVLTRSTRGRPSAQPTPTEDTSDESEAKRGNGNP